MMNKKAQDQIEACKKEKSYATYSIIDDESSIFKLAVNIMESKIKQNKELKRRIIVVKSFSV